jgi:hypothetical protein
MTQLFLWMVMVYGLSNILVYGSIFDRPRNYIIKQSENEENYFMDFFIFLRDMLSCMMCTPTWVGFFFGIFLYSPVHQILEVNPYVSWFFDGLLASGSTWAINSIIEWFEKK